MPLNYKCPECANEWTYTGNSCTTFRDGGVQTWNGDKSERIDTCTCGTEGTHITTPLKDKKVAVSFVDSGTGKQVTK
jgi:hypothetical protein